MPCIAVMLEKGIDTFSEAGCEEGVGGGGEEGEEFDKFEEGEKGEYCFILVGREMSSHRKSITELIRTR